MKAEELVGRLVLRINPVETNGTVDTEFMKTPHIIEKYFDGGITLRNPKTGYKSYCTREWDDDNWSEASPGLLLQNISRKYPGKTVVQDVLDKIYPPDHQPDDRGDITELIPALPKQKPIEDSSVTKGPVVMRDLKVTEVISTLNNISKTMNIGDVIVLESIDTQSRYKIGIKMISLRGSIRYHRYQFIEVEDEAPTAIALDCSEFHTKFERIIDYGVRHCISILEIGVLLASPNFGLENLKYIEGDMAIICAGINMYKANIHSEYAEITRDVDKDDIDCPVIILSESEYDELNEFMAFKQSDIINFSDL